VDERDVGLVAWCVVALAILLLIVKVTIEG